MDSSTSVATTSTQSPRTAPSSPTTTTHTTTANLPKSTATTAKDVSSQEGSQERPFLTNGNWIDHGVEHANRGKTITVKEPPASKKVEKPPVAEKKPKAKDTDNDIDANFTAKTEESSSEMSGSRSLIFLPIPQSFPTTTSLVSVLMVLVPIALGIVWLVLMAIFAVVICCRRRR